MKFAICNEIFKDWKLPDIFSHCAEAGYDAVELAPFTLAGSVMELSAADRLRIRAEAEEAGVVVSGIHWVLAGTDGLHITHPDSATRNRTMEYLVQLIDFCGDIGGQFMIVGSPKQRSLLEGVTLEQAMEWATDVFWPAVKRAAVRGVTICVEPLSAEETNFINTAREAALFADRFESPAMKIILDVKAMCSEGRPLPEIIRESGDKLAYFHANDGNLKGPGFGDVDFQPIATALKEVGYNGYTSVEVFDFEEGPETISRKSIKYLKQVFG